MHIVALLLSRTVVILCTQIAYELVYITTVCAVELVCIPYDIIFMLIPYYRYNVITMYNTIAILLTLYDDTIISRVYRSLHEFLTLLFYFFTPTPSRGEIDRIFFSSLLLLLF